MSPDNDPNDITRRAQDPLVNRLRPTPATPPPSGLTLVGLLGDSDRPGYRRLYLCRNLKRSVEFPTDSVTAVQDIPPEQSPFEGEQATRITLAPGAKFQFNRTQDVGDFDIDSGLALLPWLSQYGDSQALSEHGPSHNCPFYSRHYVSCGSLMCG